jgi:hypothetical protein
MRCLLKRIILTRLKRSAENDQCFDLLEAERRVGGTAEMVGDLRVRTELRVRIIILILGDC